MALALLVLMLRIPGEALTLYTEPPPEILQLLQDAAPLVAADPADPADPAAPAAEPEPEPDKKKKDKKDKKDKKKKDKKKKDSNASEPTAAAVVTDSGGGGGGSWKKARATFYNSFPDCCSDKKANQTECDKYSGCKYQGIFAYVGKKDKSWVQSNNIIAFFDRSAKGAGAYKNKKIRVRNPKTGKTLEVLVADTCGDQDCDPPGCCSKNAGSAGYLVDFEYNTAKRFYDGKVQGVADVEWQPV